MRFLLGAQANHVHVSAPALSAQQRRIELPVLVFPGAAIDGHLVAAVRACVRVRISIRVRVRDYKVCLQSAEDLTTGEVMCNKALLWKQHRIALPYKSMAD